MATLTLTEEEAARRYVDSAVDRICSELAGCSGARAVTAFRCASALGNFVGAGALSEEAAFALLMAHAPIGPGFEERVARSNIRRGITRGMTTPRELPDGHGSSVSLHQRAEPRIVSAEPLVPPPPADEVAAVWAACVAVTEDAEATAWLEGRGLNPEDVALWDLARALPTTAPTPRWAGTLRGPWGESGHRLLVPLWNADGVIASLRARLSRPDTALGSLKVLAPQGHSATGMVMACPLGVQLLQGESVEWWARPEVVVSEGDADFLTWASRQVEGCQQGPAVFGIYSGAWSEKIAAHIPGGTRIFVRTDPDAAGRKYADVICASLDGRCNLFRRPSSDLSA